MSAPSAGAGPRGWMSAPEMRIGAPTVRKSPSGCSIVGKIPTASACGSAASSAMDDAGPQISPASSKIRPHSAIGRVAKTSSSRSVKAGMLSKRSLTVPKRPSSSHSVRSTVLQNGAHQRVSGMFRMIQRSSWQRNRLASGLIRWWRSRFVTGRPSTRVGARSLAIVHAAVANRLTSTTGPSPVRSATRRPARIAATIAMPVV